MDPTAKIQRDRLEAFYQLSAPLDDKLIKLLAQHDAMQNALEAAEKWVDLQGTAPGCRDAADSMGRVIRAALALAKGETV